MRQPLFSPSSGFWRINREMATALAGPRAVLMQIAHPLVAAGVAEHSSFREHRLARLYRTSLAAAVITFGPREFAFRAIRSINRKHGSVRGVLGSPVGPFPAGTPYDANDPELKLWVLGTIADSTLQVHDLFVAPLSGAEREAYYDGVRAVAGLFGIPERIVPSTYGDFQVWFDGMRDSSTITVGQPAREIVGALFARSVTGSLLYWGSIAGIGLLPGRLRGEFGFRWDDRRQAWLERTARLSRRTRRHTPSILCTSPVATVAEWLAPV